MKTLQKITPHISVIKKNVMVKDLMSTDVLTMKMTDTVFHASQEMSSHDISTIVIAEDKKPVGIVTERDLLKKIIVQGKNPKKVKLLDIMSTNLKTIGPNESTLKAGQMMKRHNVKKLLVVDNKKELKGIITQTDIIKCLNRIYDSYQSILWNPWVLIILFVFISLLFIINALIFNT